MNIGDMIIMPKKLWVTWLCQQNYTEKDRIENITTLTLQTSAVKVVDR